MVSKEYIEREYRLAVLDFQLAKNDDDRWAARNTMARLERIAAQAFGFAYADELHEKEIGRQGKYHQGAGRKWRERRLNR